MKKLLLAILLLLLCSAALLVGCDQAAPTPPVEFLNVVQNKATEYKIVSYTSDRKLATNLATDLLIKTGARFEVVDEVNDGEKAIYIGSAENLAKQCAVLTGNLTYTTYEIAIDNGSIYLAFNLDSIADAVIADLKEAIVKIDGETYGIDKSIAGIHNIADISAVVPEFQTKSGKMLEVYEAGSGNYQIAYQQLKLTESDREVENYEQALLDAGYTLHQSSEINESRFFTYVNGDTQVHCNYYKTKREFRIIYGPKSYLGSAEPITDYEKKVTPSISIVGATDSVLSMVYQAPDGSFVIIDGGYGEDRTYNWTMNAGTANEMTYTINRDIKKDMESLWALLESKTPAGQKPQVTWMMTHGDPDHICLPPLFMKEYQDKFDLNLVVYNFPIVANVGLKNGDATTFQNYINTFIKSAKQYFPDAPHMVFHTGQKLYLPGTEIECLYTHEDEWPKAMPWMNDTCSAWRITSEGKTVMVTGDIDGEISTQMVRVFGNYLKSDVLQLNHHGSTGGNLAFYKIVAPEVAIWACEDNRFLYDTQRLGTKAGFEYNKYIRETVKYHYSGSYTHTILLPSLEEEK